MNMNTRSRPLHIIRYEGYDLPGLLHAISQQLFDMGFDIESVSMASGGGGYETFVACRRKSKQIDRQEDMSDRSLLEFSLTQILKTYYADYTRVTSIDVPPPIKPVTVITSYDPWFHFTIGIDLVFGEKTGLWACLTNLLKRHFSLVEAHMYPYIVEDGVSNKTVGQLLYKSYILLSLPSSPLNVGIPDPSSRGSDISKDSNKPHEQFIRNYENDPTSPHCLSARLRETLTHVDDAGDTDEIVQRVNEINQQLIPLIKDANLKSDWGELKSTDVDSNYLRDKGQPLLEKISKLILTLSASFHISVSNMSIIWTSDDQRYQCGLRMQYKDNQPENLDADCIVLPPNLVVPTGEEISENFMERGLSSP